MPGCLRQDRRVPSRSSCFDAASRGKTFDHVSKCLGVRSGKLLGFIASGKGIEVDPTKVKEIQEMPSSCTEKEVTRVFK